MASQQAVNSQTAPTRIVAITSGKGGVGKTSVSVNLAIALAQEGARVCVLDADTGLANINILLGLVPRHTLEHVFSGERQVADILLRGPAGVDIIPGASGLVSHVHLDVAAQKTLVAGLQGLERQYDYLLIDTAAGISATVLHFVASAQTALVVITPEPTSLTDAFSLLKVLRQKGYKRPVQVVVNMAVDSRQAWRIFERFSHAVQKYIGLQTQWLAAIGRDDSMRRAIMLQKPAMLLNPESPTAASFSKMAAMLDQYFQENTVPNSVFSRYWQRVFERVAERAAARQTAPANPASVESASASVPAAAVSAGSGADSHQETIAADSGEEQERQWAGARRRLVEMIQGDQVTNDQVLQLFGELIDAAGDAVAHFGADLAYYLLSRCQPENLDIEQRQLLDLELFRLGIRQSIAVPASADASVPASTSVSPATRPEGSDTSPRKHSFDEAGFGSQEELLRRLQEATNGESLTALLASLRHASLVRED